MNITQTDRGYDREVSMRNKLPIYAVNRDGPTRLYAAADVGVEMWDFFNNDCRGLDVGARDALLAGEFMMGKAQVHNYMKLAILLNDDVFYDVIKKSLIGGIEYVVRKHGNLINLKYYFAGTRPLPF